MVTSWKVQDRPLILNSMVCFAVLGLVYYLNYFKPIAFVYLTVEDSWAEYGTFFCYFMAFILSVGAIFIDRRSFLKPGYILMATGFFFIGMEEISWGQRLFDIETPGILYKLSSQSELNLHNVVDCFPLLPVFCTVVLAWAVVLPIFTSRMPKLKELCSRFGIPQAPAYIQFFRPFVCCEVSELTLSFAFVLLTEDIFIQALSSTAFWKITHTALITILIVLTFALTGLFVFSGAGSKKWADRFYQLVVVGYP